MKKISRQISYFFGRLLSVLRVRPVVAGLEISDAVLRMAYSDGNIWRMHAIRLEPGVMEKGRIKNRETLIASLIELKTRSEINGRNKNKKINVVVSLSSAGIYSQVFTLPPLSGEDLDKAIRLNLQMASPGEAAKTYSSWQVVGKDDASRLDVLSAFIEREIVDDIVRALSEANFLTMAVESRSLALTRTLREKSPGIDINKSYLLVSVDSAGLEFLVVRNGELYFEYANQWSEITDEKGEISKEKFQTEFLGSLRQVTNFYSQHWAEPISAVIIAAINFHDELEKIVSEHLSLPSLRLTLEMGQQISSEWLVALGCSLRGNRSVRRRKEISLLGEDLEDRFQDDQIMNFMRFWRFLIPAALGVLVVMFIVTFMFLGHTKTNIESSSSFSLSIGQMGEIDQLQASSTKFNNFVAIIRSAEDNLHPKYKIIEETKAIAETNGITLSRFSFQGEDTPASLTGIASSEDQILAFKNALGMNPDFTSINLPLTSIQPAAGSFSFSVTFMFSPKAATQ